MNRAVESELSRSLELVLGALADRARRTERSPAMWKATAEIRQIFSLSQRCQSALSTLSGDGPEELAREAGVTVTIERRPLPSASDRAPEAMEQALLLTQVGALATEALRGGIEGDPLGAFVWDEGAPVGRTVLAGGRSVAMVAARPSAAGRGIGIAAACGSTSRRGLAPDPAVTITLMVPHLRTEDGDPEAWIVQLRTA